MEDARRYLIEDLRIGDVVGVMIETSYAIAVLEFDDMERNWYGRLRNSIKLRCIQSDAGGLWKRNAKYQLTDGIKVNIFKLPRNEEQKWKLLLEV